MKFWFGPGDEDDDEEEDEDEDGGEDGDAYECPGTE